MSRLGENTQQFLEVIPISSSLSGRTLGYSMEDCEKITFLFGMGTAAAAATAITPHATAIQSADEALSTSGGISGATGLVGPTTANQLSQARSVVITFGTAATGAQTLTLNGYTLTFSTAGAATVSTALTFGSTEGSTVDTGLDKASTALISAINNSTLSYWMRASSVSTAIIRITAKDTASTGITAVTTAAAAYALTLEKAHSIIEIRAADLDSTSKYVGLNLGTVATSVTVAVAVIKHGLRYAPGYQSAQVHVKST